jgi:hypothetical protein
MQTSLNILKGLASGIYQILVFALDKALQAGVGAAIAGIIWGPFWGFGLISGRVALIVASIGGAISLEWFGIPKIVILEFMLTKQMRENMSG